MRRGAVAVALALAVGTAFAGGLLWVAPRLSPEQEPERSGRPVTTSSPVDVTRAPAEYPDPEDLPPPGKAVYGVWTERGPYDLADLEAFTAAAGRPPNAMLFTQGWATDEFDPSLLDAVVSKGMFPIVAWEPWDYAQESTVPWLRGEQPDYALARIIEGAFDDYVRDWARGLARWGQPVGLRFAHEMNGDWYPWAEAVNGNRSGEYIAAWRHVHRIFSAEGADNVIWIWSPNLIFTGTTPLAPLYPGDAYVDWAGLVGFFGHDQRPVERWPTFAELYGPTLEEIRVLTDRPILITEAGATEVGGHKAPWITDFLDSLLEEPDVIGFVWFEADKETDWRIASSPESVAAFATGVRDPRFDWAYPP